MKRPLLTYYIHTVNAAGTVAAVFLVWWMYEYHPVRFVPNTLFGVLATIPGILAIVYHFTSALPRYSSRRQSITDYRDFCKAFDVWWQDVAWPRKLRALGLDQQAAANQDIVPLKQFEPRLDDTVSHRPMTAAALWSAMLVTLVFMVAASVALDKGRTPGFPMKIVEPLVPASPDGMNGFLFAALGAFVSVMWRMINRINANALTSRFMFTAALRSTIAIMIGLAAGQIGLFGILSNNGAREALFFFTGLFTDWALSSLRSRARTVFSTDNPACARLPLCLIDGLDDGVIDILDEIGIWDTQHLATSEPGELTIRTLYPFNRIIDWIDQAILISYVRDKGVAAAREFGIRGAMDLTGVYSYTIGEDNILKEKALKILDGLADKSGMTREGVELVCSNLWLDYTVEQLYRYWQHFAKEQPDARAPVNP